MINAISAVTQEDMSVRRAAETYTVPRSKLGNRISGRIVHGVRHPNLTLHVVTSLFKSRVTDDSGKSVLHTCGRARTHNEYTYCACSLLPITFQTKRILLLVTCKEDEQVVWVAALGQHSQLLYLTSPSRGEQVVAEEGAS